MEIFKRLTTKLFLVFFLLSIATQLIPVPKANAIDQALFDKAVSVCKNITGQGDTGVLNTACRRGYLGAAGGETQDKSCPSGIDDSCNQGWEAFGAAVAPDTTQAVNLGKASDACYSQTSNQKKKDCRDGYLAGLDGKADPCGSKKEKKACEIGYNAGKKNGIDSASSVAAIAYCKDKTGTEKTGCEKGFDNAALGLSSELCDKTFSGKALAACKEANGSSAAKDSSNPDCESSSKSKLSWIICPIVDLGAGFTDFVFKEFVRGILEDVPISTEPTDGGYRAWQQFRILGNIVLIGTLLAVVFAQIRGDK